MLYVLVGLCTAQELHCLGTMGWQPEQVAAPEGLATVQSLAKKAGGPFAAKSLARLEVLQKQVSWNRSFVTVKLVSAAALDLPVPADL